MRKHATPSEAFPADTDTRYGLDPVLDERQDPRFSPLTVYAAVQCPYCGGTYDSAVDLTAGNQDCIEDCQVCCQPIQMRIELRDGKIERLEARRGDEA